VSDRATRPVYDAATGTVIGVLLELIAKSWKTGELVDFELVTLALELCAFEEEDAPMAARDLAALARGALVGAERDGTPVMTTLNESWPLLGSRPGGSTTTNKAG
jgi:hypothetical protein